MSCEKATLNKDQKESGLALLGEDSSKQKVQQVQTLEVVWYV